MLDITYKQLMCGDIEFVIFRILIC